MDIFLNFYFKIFQNQDILNFELSKNFILYIQKTIKNLSILIFFFNYSKII